MFADAALLASAVPTRGSEVRPGLADLNSGTSSPTRQMPLSRSDALGLPHAQVEARLRTPGKMRSANVQLAFGSLFSRPKLSVGLN